LAEEKGQVIALVPLGQAQLERAQVHNDKFSGGIKDGGDFLPTLGLRGRQFRIRQNKQEVALDNRSLDVILVTAREALSKSYYAGAFQPGTSKQPDCKSADGIRPDADVKNPINKTCVDCRMNAWGSKVNQETGSQGKACADYKLLVLAPPTLDGDKPLQLQLPAMSLRDKDKYTESLGSFIKLLNHNGLAADEVVTKLSFTDDAFPRVKFQYVRNLTAAEVAKVREVAQRDDVKATVSTEQATLAPEKHASEQPAAVTNAPAPPAQTANPTDQASGGQTETTDAGPEGDVANILAQWGAKGK
jgi:hypothetical protein